MSNGGPGGMPAQFSVSVILAVVFLAESPMFDGVHVCIMDVG